MITQAEHDAAMAEEIHVYPVEDVFHEFAPYFAEQVRKDVVDRYGNPALLRGGLKVFTTMDSERQRAAQEAMLGGLLQVDKRQGFRGPVMHARHARAAEGLRRPEREGARAASRSRTTGYYVALVTAIDDDGRADVQVGHAQGRAAAARACAGRAR